MGIRNSAVVAGLTSATAKGRLKEAVSAGEIKTVQKYFRVAEIGSIVEFILITIIVACVGVFLITQGNREYQEYTYDAPEIPAVAGGAPSAYLIDETGLVADAHYDYIQNRMSNFASEYNLHLATYSSAEEFHNVYDEFFNDERGVVVYIKQNEGVGEIKFYWGNNLNYLFTEDNVKYLTDKVQSLNRPPASRVDEINIDLYYGFKELFDIYGTRGSSYFVEYGVGAIAILISPAMGFLSYSLLFIALGLPVSRKRREALLADIITAIQSQQEISSKSASACDAPNEPK